VQHIIVEDSVFGEFLRDQALSGIDFLDLAEKHYPGAEEIRVAAADLGYIGPDEMPEEFFKMAMRTAKGDVSHPVKTEWGYHIIYVVDKQINKSLEQVRNQIANLLRQQHQKEFRTQWQNELLSRHDVKYNLEPVKKIELPPLNERK
jgi:parvulin-like peptidyl-prolyl isomerase